MKKIARMSEIERWFVVCVNIKRLETIVVEEEKKGSENWLVGGQALAIVLIFIHFSTHSEMCSIQIHFFALHIIIEKGKE